jgi:beta-N-acetylhexosaminidase
MAVPIQAFISGCAGQSLSDAERTFFRETNPWGLIVFRRNVKSTGQLAELAQDFRRCVDRKDAPVLVDQEGGRVQRLSPASGDWRQYPSAQSFAKVYEREPAIALRAARNSGRLMAEDLHAAGITIDCLPVLDLPVSGSTEAIGSRAYGSDAPTIIALAQAHIAGLMDGGVLPVMKHIPGHGRAMVDSHFHLPVVETSQAELLQSDFVPFAAFAHLPMAMTAHVVYTAIDKNHPATHSKRVISRIIRDQLGFQGLLMTDDLSMQALQGTLAERAAAALAAGCDLALHCSGVMEEMQAVAAVAGPLKGKSLRRARLALKCKRKPASFDRKLAVSDVDYITTQVA